MNTPTYRWEDVRNPRGLLHIVHGMSEHGGRYARLASALNAAGFIVWAHDHRGHGQDPTPPVGLGHFADSGGWRALVDDAVDVSSLMRTTFAGLPLVLFAHSMGSFVGQTVLSEHGGMYQAAVLSGTNGPPGVLEKSVRALAYGERTIRGGRAAAEAVSGLVMGRYNRQFSPNRTPFDWLSRDPGEVDRYVADPLCGFTLTTQAWVDFLDGKALLSGREQRSRIPAHLPILLLSGTRDPVGENGRGVERLVTLYKQAGLSHVTLQLYPDARHELVNELNREIVTADLIAWVDAALAGQR